MASDLPQAFLSRVFELLDLRDAGACCSVCRKWFFILADENCPVWKGLCCELVPENIRKCPAPLFRSRSFKGKLRAYYYRWNPQDVSPNIGINDGFSIVRRPVAMSTDGARTLKGFRSGRHCWEVHWPSPTGSEAVLGVATKDAAMQSKGYIPLLGNTDEGWGWHLGKSQLWHAGKAHGKYPRSGTNGEALGAYAPGQPIRVILDMDQGMLAFERGSEFLGVAFDILPTDEVLYPSFSAVYGNTEITLVYIGTPIEG